MCKWILFAYFWLQINNINRCTADSHAITNYLLPNLKDGNGYTGDTFFDRILFFRNSTTPQSYVVGFKYIGDTYSTFIYSGTIYSDANNTYGHGDLGNGRGLHDDHYSNAEIHIPNATNFHVDVELRGMGGLGRTPGQYHWLRLKAFPPRSLALICAIDNSQPKTKHRHMWFGARKNGDVILHARKEIFSSTDIRLPRQTFEFQDDDAIITAAVIRVNSPKAIVFHNKVQLTQHRFSATIYGLNRNTIACALIIYGHRT